MVIDIEFIITFSDNIDESSERSGLVRRAKSNTCRRFSGLIVNM